MLGSIILGWWYWITNANNKISKERLSICSVCPIRKGMLCSDCGCVLQAKARLKEEECPRGFWK